VATAAPGRALEARVRFDIAANESVKLVDEAW
jgi:hypothetical protein